MSLSWACMPFVSVSLCTVFFFFFNDTATTEIYTLSLHDALPIYINMVRTTHYPPAQGFIDLADEMGMYVIDEVPMGYGGEFGDDPSFMESGLRRAQETIQRDRNHPSVIVWSIGNEDPFTAMHLAAIRLVKGSDPTRPMLMPWRGADFLVPEIEILAPHYRSPSNLDQLAARSNRVILTTEYT